MVRMQSSELLLSLTFPFTSRSVVIHFSAVLHSVTGHLCILTLHVIRKFSEGTAHTRARTDYPKARYLELFPQRVAS
jgi:hypothetical protein